MTPVAPRHDVRMAAEKELVLVAITTLITSLINDVLNGKLQGRILPHRFGMIFSVCLSAVTRLSFHKECLVKRGEPGDEAIISSWSECSRTSSGITHMLCVRGCSLLHCGHDKHHTRTNNIPLIVFIFIPASYHTR